MSVHVLNAFLNWVLLVYYCILRVIYVFYLYKIFHGYVICKYFLPKLFFIFFGGSNIAKVLKFDNVQFFHISFFETKENIIYQGMPLSKPRLWDAVYNCNGGKGQFQLNRYIYWAPIVYHVLLCVSGFFSKQNSKDSYPCGTNIQIGAHRR